MGIVSMQLDPNAVAYTDNEIVGKINTASDQITRGTSVSAAARPIETSEITDIHLVAGAIKTKLGAESDANKLVSSLLAAEAGVTNAQVVAGLANANLNAMAALDREYIKTSPTKDEYPVIAIQRDAAGKLDVDYDDAPIG